MRRSKKVFWLRNEVRVLRVFPALAGFVPVRVADPVTAQQVAGSIAGEGG